MANTRPARSVANWEADVRKRLRVAAAAVQPGRWAFTAVPRSHQLRLRVQYRPPVGVEGPAQSANLPLPLVDTPEAIAELSAFVVAVARQMATGSTLQGSVQATDAARHIAANDWSEIAERFEQWKRHAGNSVAEITWQRNYAPFVGSALEVLAGKAAPNTGSDLVLRVAKLGDWASGTRRRQQCVDALVQLLEFGVQECGLSARWLEGVNRKTLKGRPSAEQRNASRNRLITVSDPEIVALIDGLAGDSAPTAARQRWISALRLMALTGIRPTELLHLELRQLDGEVWLHCNYSKVSGNGKTQPRKLQPFELRRADGSLTDWWPALLLQFRTKTWELPPITTGTCAADNIATFLKRQPAFTELRAIYREQGYGVTAYFTRDAYARRAHELGGTTAEAALWMGHSEQTHASSYPWVDVRNADATAQRLRERQQAAL